METNTKTDTERPVTHDDPPPPTLQGSAHLRPIFLGNLDYGVSTEEIEDIFLRPALDIPPVQVDRVDLKRGFCFVFLKDVQSDEEKERVESYVNSLNGM